MSIILFKYVSTTNNKTNIYNVLIKYFNILNYFMFITEGIFKGLIYLKHFESSNWLRELKSFKIMSRGKMK